ncbi:hypothetical protein [Symbiopectobacterium sp. RP]|uniref:hypothetical protein n=1 Tax=Symbiopectobacterium sp. RP TaxID=3248553 RepID=UPI003D2DABBD
MAIAWPQTTEAAQLGVFRQREYRVLRQLSAWQLAPKPVVYRDGWLYYWRWGIESFFKLLKGAGHDVEKWLERSAGALLRRLLIASMACVLVWRLQRVEGDDNAAARQLICRLSGRQQKRGPQRCLPDYPSC